MTVNIFSSGLTVNGNASLSGNVVAPDGTVIVNGTLTGSITADRLIINGGGVVKSGS